MSERLLAPDGTPVLVRDQEVWTMDIVGKVGSVDVSNRKMRIIGTDESIDREGDIIMVSGWKLANYKKNPVFLWAHNYHSVPLAKTDKLIKRKDPLRYEFQLRYPTLGLYPFADMVLEMYGEQMINASSVGFIPQEWEKLDEDEGKARRVLSEEEKLLFWHEPRRYTKQELLELSGCPVPANPNALTPDALGQRSFGGTPAVEMFKWIQESQIPQPKNMDDILEEIECAPLLIEDETAPVMVQVKEQITDASTSNQEDDEAIEPSPVQPRLNRRTTEEEEGEEEGEGKEEEGEPDSPEMVELDINGPFEIEFEEEDMVELEEVLKPFPNEHSCRLKPPNYPKYARKNCYRRIDAKCVDFIFGIKGPKKSELQAMRFKKATWTAAAAKKVCSARGGSFEAAKEIDVSVTLDSEIQFEKDKFYVFKVDKEVDDEQYSRIWEQLKTEKGLLEINFILLTPSLNLTMELLEMPLEKARHLSEVFKRLTDVVFPAEDLAGQEKSDGPGKESNGGTASAILGDAFKDGDSPRTPTPESPSLKDRLKSSEGQELLREIKRFNNEIKKLFGR